MVKHDEAVGQGDGGVDAHIVGELEPNGSVELDPNASVALAAVEGDAITTPGKTETSVEGVGIDADAVRLVAPVSDALLHNAGVLLQERGAVTDATAVVAAADTPADTVDDGKAVVCHAVGVAVPLVDEDGCADVAAVGRTPASAPADSLTD